MQIIKAAGAQALTTAGSPRKRALLRMLGAKRAASSRDIAFVGELLETGVSADVVLNTLTSTGMVAASLALLSGSAHFVEISKRDIWSKARMAQGKPFFSIFAYFMATYDRSEAYFSCFTLLLLQSAPMSATASWLWTSCRRMRCMKLSCGSPGGWLLERCARSPLWPTAWALWCLPCGRCPRPGMWAKSSCSWHRHSRTRALMAPSLSLVALVSIAAYECFFIFIFNNCNCFMRLSLKQNKLKIKNIIKKQIEEILFLIMQVPWGH
jgi:hypothetical protein